MGVKEYLKHSTERINRDEPDLKQKHEELKRKMDAALSVPTEKCIDHNEHNFVLLSHIDTKKQLINYFRCDKCDEVVVSKQIRRSDDLMRYL